jgi:hypothetical protein
LAPNAALKWEPEADQIDPSVNQTPLAAQSTTEHGRIWVITHGNLVRPISVTTGMSDGIMTEISGDEVHEGLKVVTGEIEATDGSSQATSDKTEETKNPFVPTPGKGSKPPPGPM